MQTSSLFNLDLKDLTKGFLVAVISAFITALQNSAAAGSIIFNWQNIGSVALAAGLSYLCKNFFTPSKIVSQANSSEKKS